MTSVVIDAANLCVRLVCGVGETDVTFEASAIYKAWKDWFVLSDNSKYLPAFDSAGGDPVGTAALDNIYFLQTQNGWRVCPETTELQVIIRIDGNMFPAVVGAQMFGYDSVAIGGHTHIETTVSTSARLIETGVSGLTSQESTKLLSLGTAEETADAVWDEAYSEHNTAGTFGKLMDVIRKANLSIDGSVTANPTTTSFDTDLDEPTGTHNHQLILFVTGSLTGFSRPILTFTNGVANTVTLQEPLPATPQVGDEFVILPQHVHPVNEISEAVWVDLTTRATP